MGRLLNLAMAGALALSPLAGCAHDIDAHASSSKPETTLQLRPGSGHTYQLSHRDGVCDLAKLAGYGEKEDAWVFLDGTWTDVGTRESRGSVYMDKEAFRYALDPAQGNTALFYYHIHPFKAPPSPGDVYARVAAKFSLLNREIMFKTIRDREKFDVRFVSRVVDESGMWEYGVTEDLERQILAEPVVPDRYARENILYNDLERGLLQNYFGVVLDDGDDISDIKLLININDYSGVKLREKVRKYTDYASSKGVIVSYMPVEPLCGVQ